MKVLLRTKKIFGVVSSKVKKTVFYNYVVVHMYSLVPVPI